MSWLVKCLPNKLEDLSSVPTPTYESQMVAGVSLQPWHWRYRDSLVKPVSSTLSGRLSQKMKQRVESWLSIRCPQFEGQD